MAALSANYFKVYGAGGEMDNSPTVAHGADTAAGVDDFVVLPSLDEYNYVVDATAHDKWLQRKVKVAPSPPAADFASSDDLVYEFTASSDCYFPPEATDAVPVADSAGTRASGQEHTGVRQARGDPYGHTGSRCAEFDESSDCYSPIESVEVIDAFDPANEVLGRSNESHQSGKKLINPKSPNAGHEACTIRSSYVHVDDFADVPTNSQLEDGDAKPKLCRIILHHDEMNGRQRMMDALRAVVKRMSRVDAAYIVQEAFAAGSSRVCVCSQADAELYLAGLQARGLHVSLDSRSDTAVDDPAESTPLYRVMLHTERNDMRHMLYVLNALRRVMGGMPEVVANEVMQEAQYEGTALVCICPKERANAFAAGLHEYGLDATLEQQRNDGVCALSKTYIEAARFGMTMTKMP